jgi:protein Mpv17
MWKRLTRVLNSTFVPVISVFKSYNALASKYPFCTAVLTAGLQTTIGDLVAQLILEKRKQVDWRRTGLFASFGLIYNGGFQYYLYVIKFQQWHGTISRFSGPIGAAPAKTFLDQFIHVPTLYFPAFYAFKAVVEGRPLVTGEDSAVNRYGAEYFECWKACWALWVPAQVVNFTFVPSHLRLPFVSTTSLLWVTYLSAMQAAFDKACETKKTDMAR